MSDAGAWLESRRPWLLWLAHQRYGIIDADDAQDIVQIASIKAWQRWDTWEDRGHGREGWVAAIVGNAARDWQRHCGVGQRACSRLDAMSSPDAEELALLRLLVREVWVMLTTFERQLVLMVAAGYTMREMGEHHGKTLAAIKSQEYRLRSRMASVAMQAA